MPKKRQDLSEHNERPLKSALSRRDSRHELQRQVTQPFGIYKLDLGKELKNNTVFNAPLNFDNRWQMLDRVKMNASKEYVS
jgi:hypothetical protein